MRVAVKLFATLAACHEGAEPGLPFQADLPEGATVADLVLRLDLPREQVKVAFVNGRARPMHWPLAPDDQVGIFPPIGGG